MSVKSLDIIYCKDCKYYDNRIIDKYSSIHTCKKSSDKFDIEKPSLYCNRSCYRKKNTKDKVLKNKKN